MAETDYYAVLGVEPENTGEAASGENESGVAEPVEADVEEMQNAEGRMQNDESAVGTVEDGGNAEGMAGEEDTSSTASGPASPPEEGFESGADAAGRPVEDAGPYKETGRLPQSREENARYAAARRKAEAERDAAVAQVREEAKQYAENAVAEVLKTAGFTNPYTGQPVRTKAEFDAYAARLSEEQKNAVLQGSGMTEEQFAAFMETQPEVQKAREAQKKAEAVIREAREREAKAKIDEQMKEITALNPAITSLADLTKLESYPALYEKVKKGYSIADAYKLTNMGDIESRAVARAQQQTRNAERTKAHLKQTESRGTGSVEVPADVKAEYRMFNPGITDADIQKHYAGYVKR